MTLDEFEEKVKSSVEAFSARWRRGNKDSGYDDEAYPLEMDADEWWEYFLEQTDV